MILDINKHSGVPIYRQIIDQVKNQIMTGRLKENEQLATVAELSKQIGVNPMTISKAYAWMVQDGLLERRTGVGVFVNRIRQDHRDREKKALLAQAMKSVVDLARQMGMTEEDVRSLLKQQYNKRNSNKG